MNGSFWLITIRKLGFFFIGLFCLRYEQEKGLTLKILRLFTKEYFSSFVKNFSEKKPLKELV